MSIVVLALLLGGSGDRGISAADPQGQREGSANQPCAAGSAAGHSAKCERTIGAGGDPDPYIGLQWALEQIHAIEAWQVSTGRGAIIAVLDSGVDLDHPDLVDQLVVLPGSDFVDAVDLDGPQDRNSHGTWTAGLAAASTNNGIGVAGAAPNAKIMPVRVADNSDQVSTVTDALVWIPDRLARGIVFATDHRAHVISMSLAVAEQEMLLTERAKIDAAIEYAWARGVVLVASSGNNVRPDCGYPASHPLVVCVGGTTRDDERIPTARFDALGATTVFAPGGYSFLAAAHNRTGCEEMLLSTYLPSVSPLSCDPDPPQSEYQHSAGTSGSAPYVAAVAALLVEQGLTNEDIVDRILHTADDLGEPGRDPLWGWGRVNALRAVSDDRN